MRSHADDIVMGTKEFLGAHDDPLGDRCELREAGRCLIRTTFGDHGVLWGSRFCGSGRKPT